VTAPEITIPEGWIPVTVQQPQKVLDIFEGDVDGWAAFHRGDLAGAAPTSDPTLRLRLAQETRATRQALSDLLRVTGPELARTWARSSGIPAQSAVHTWAALVAVDADEDPAALLALAPVPSDPSWANVHRALGSDLPEEGLMAIVAERAAGPIGDCLRAHQAVRSGAAPVSTLDTACPQPLLVEDGGARTLPDPLRLQTILRVTPPSESPPSWLPATLFSAAWGPEDTTSAPGRGPTAGLLGLGSAATPSAALAQVQQLTRTLDSWRPDGTEPGARLVSDLNAFDVFQARLVASWVSSTDLPPLVATEALRAARDANAGHELGPTRPARLLALEARVAVEAGHYRAALPSLQSLAPLVTVFPELPGITELVNDLQVSSTLGRTGDSKEP